MKTREVRKGKSRPICTRCGNNPCTRQGRYKDGAPKYKNICANCVNAKKREKIMIDLKCSKCSYVGESIHHLDIDHIDGNPKNNKRENLQVLCPNCHRKKTLENGDYKKKNLTLIVSPCES